ncbi:hypothetical protein DITRI_Ditri15bG0109900 [Diplodiscus trichospermus]
MPMSIFLNQDIIEDILSRLPVKSLLRFKCVSRSWSAFISSPSFSKLHFERVSGTKILASTPSGVKLLERETCFGGEIRLDFPPRKQDNRVRILGSCHGLVAVALESNNGFFIWNPLTGDYKELPDPCFPSPMEINKFLDNGFVPWSEETNFNGFGYDSSTDDYKLFFSVQKSCWLPPMANSFRMEITTSIFSLKKNSWRLIQSPPTNPLFFFRQNLSGCFVNGALHWVTRESKIVKILAFDLKTERFSRLAVPNKENIKHIIINMAVLDGKLCLTFHNFDFSLNYPRSSYPVELWVMEEYGVEQSWNKLLSIGDTDACYSLRRPFCISEGKQVISINEEKELVRSGADDSTVEKFRICHFFPKMVIFPPEKIHHCQAIVYAESLISPNVIIIEDEQQNQGRIRKGRALRDQFNQHI